MVPNDRNCVHYQRRSCLDRNNVNVFKFNFHFHSSIITQWVWDVHGVAWMLRSKTESLNNSVGLSIVPTNVLFLSQRRLSTQNDSEKYNTLFLHSTPSDTSKETKQRHHLSVCVLSLFGVNVEVRCSRRCYIVFGGVIDSVSTSLCWTSIHTKLKIVRYWYVNCIWFETLNFNTG